MRLAKTFGLSFALSLGAGASFGQSAAEHHIWQDARYFTPYSRTAAAITGPIHLSGNAVFATPGSRMYLRFANGTGVELISEGASWRGWEYSSDAKQTAEVFRAASTPAELLNGNRLCGGASDLPMFFVFHEAVTYTQSNILSLAVFQSAAPPSDINSDGLCGTYTYEIDGGS